jgi:NADH-quinone oxidoreductase subunit J
VEAFVFIVSAAVIVAGAIGVVGSRNPVNAAMSLVATLFGVAVLFIANEAHFLAAIQVIVYAGAIVVLFLFVIMLLGVDRTEDLETEPIVGQRPAALIGGLVFLCMLLSVFLLGSDDTETITGGSTVAGAPAEIVEAETNTSGLGRILFTDYVFAFELTGVLLTIAVIGAVVMARRKAGDDEPVPEIDETEGLFEHTSENELAAAEDHTERADLDEEAAD